MKDSQNNSPLIIGLVVVLLLLVVGVGAAVFVNQNSDTETTEVSTQTPNEETSENDSKSEIADFEGTYSGRAQILTGAFNFPESQFSITSDGSVRLVANGLNLGITQNESFAVEGQFPLAQIDASGQADLQDDGSVRMTITELKISLTVNDQPVNEENTATVLAAVTDVFNTEIPQPTTDSPLIVDTTMVITQDNELTVSNKPGAADQISVSFRGTEI